MFSETVSKRVKEIIERKLSWHICQDSFIKK